MSVLLVTYNHIRFIERAIASIEAQVVDFELEVVVADDNSDDGTRERLLEWADSTSLTVRVLPEEARLGITLNYARGFSNVRGEFIAVLEGDDEWIWTEKLQIQSDHLRSRPDRTMVANRVLLYDDSTGSSTVVPAIGFEAFSLTVTAQRLAETNWFATFSACMYRADVIERIGARVFETTSFDWMINLAVLGFGPAGFLPEVMTLYRLHGGGEWSRSSEYQRDVRIRDLLPEYIELAPPQARPELTRTLHMLESRLRVSPEANGLDRPAPPASDAPATAIPRVGGERARVSVLMATYNHEAWIEEAIQSVLQQSMGDFEVIVVDDASQDRSSAIAARFADPRIRHYRLPTNQGGAAALNFAIQQARGDFVAVISSDDAWEPSKLERQLREFEEYPASIAVFTGARFVGEDGKPLTAARIPPWHDIFRQRNRSQGQWLRYFFENGNALCHPSVLIRRDFYLTHELYDNRLRQIPDLLMWIEVVKAGPIRVIGDEDLVRFRVLSGEKNLSSTSRANVVRGMHEHLAVNERMFEGITDELLLDGFGELLVDPSFSSPEQREVEIALLWWNRHCAMRDINRITALRLLRELLGREDTALILRTRYDFRDLNLHALAGEDTVDLRAGQNAIGAPVWWEGALAAAPAEEMVRAVWSRIRRARFRTVVRRGVRMLRTWGRP
ncbi:MAG: glycosyltransferase [Pseudolysinimonas sp.]|uniref:glycosyltransferase family 2 protein n=1 Tax=Pseudolysinimonas sp. TaxID=2680009 RepID=UPI0032656268